MSSKKNSKKTTFKELIRSPHIHIALAAGFSIIVLAYFSKRVLPEPLENLWLAFPPFIATIFEAVLGKCKNSKICTTWYWVVGIFLATAFVIVLHLPR